MPRILELPEKIEGVSWVGDKPGIDSILYVAGMTKSGPWYHLAGIVGDDYRILQPNTQLHVSIYPVYPRSYWGMDSSYVCVTGVDTPAISTSVNGNTEIAQKSLPGKRVIGDVFRYEFSGLNLIKCDNYQVYLLEDLQPGTKGKLILDSKTQVLISLFRQKILKNIHISNLFLEVGIKQLI